MKKILQFIIVCILFIPLLVNAETCNNDKVTISTITVADKSNNVEELNNATTSNNNININLNMSNVGDNIKYKFIVNNDSNDDYYLNKNSIKVSSNYVDYNIESGDNSNIVKAKTAKAFYLNVLYKNQVPENAFENGSFNDEITMKVNLSSENIQNPKTGIKYYLIIAFIITIMIVMTFSFKKKRKKNRFEFLIIGLALLLPIGVKALCRVDININSNIKIDKPIVCESFENDSWDVISHNVKNGNDACYHVGDTKEIDMGTFGTHTVRIANKSTPVECSNPGFSQSACGFVIEFADIIVQHEMNSIWTNEGGWPACVMRTYVSNDIYNALPSELKNSIISTNVISGHSWINSINFASTDKLYLLSYYEIYGNNIDLGFSGTASDTTRQLDYYNSLNISYSNITETYKNYNNSMSGWWTRSPYADNSGSFFGVYDCGYVEDGNADISCGVSPAFRLEWLIEH